MSFEARCVAGSGRGKTIGIPTVNVEPSDVPRDMDFGVYACKISLDESEFFDAVLHYGPRPSFNDSLSCEAHLLDETLTERPSKAAVRLFGRLRSVMTFESADALVRQINDDVLRAREALRVD